MMTPIRRRMTKTNPGSEPRSIPAAAKRATRPDSQARPAVTVVEEPDGKPAYVRECAAGWHVYNGRDELCCSFSKSYDACRLHGRLLVLCKCYPGAVDVVEYRWDETSSAFVEHRRYTDESPFCDDLV